MGLGDSESSQSYWDASHLAVTTDFTIMQSAFPEQCISTPAKECGMKDKLAATRQRTERAPQALPLSTCVEPLPCLSLSQAAALFADFNSDDLPSQSKSSELQVFLLKLRLLLWNQYVANFILFVFGGGIMGH